MVEEEEEPEEVAPPAPRPRGRPRKDAGINGKAQPTLQIEADMESALDSLLGGTKSL